MSIIERFAFDITEWNIAKEGIIALSDELFPQHTDRLRRFKFLDDAKRSFVGYALQRFFICKRYDIMWKDVTFVQEPYQKPIISPQIRDRIGKDIDFNVSHDGHFVVLSAISSNGIHPLKIGVDIMQHKLPPPNETVDEFLNSFTEIFSTREWRQIYNDKIETNSNIPSRLKNFYRFWAHKEAYVKAIGAGLSMPLERIEFIIEDKQRAKLFIDSQPCKGWIFEMQTLRPVKNQAGNEFNFSCVIAVGTDSDVESESLDIQGLDEPWQVLSMNDILQYYNVH